MTSPLAPTTSQGLRRDPAEQIGLGLTRAAPREYRGTPLARLTAPVVGAVGLVGPVPVARGRPSPDDDPRPDDATPSAGALLAPCRGLSFSAERFVLGHGAPNVWAVGVRLGRRSGLIDLDQTPTEHCTALAWAARESRYAAVGVCDDSPHPAIRPLRLQATTMGASASRDTASSAFVASRHELSFTQRV